jgi:hypothetical protein
MIVLLPYIGFIKINAICITHTHMYLFIVKNTDEMNVSDSQPHNRAWIITYAVFKLPRQSAPLSVSNILSVIVKIKILKSFKGLKYISRSKLDFQL